MKSLQLYRFTILVGAFQNKKCPNMITAFVFNFLQDFELDKTLKNF